MSFQRLENRTYTNRRKFSSSLPYLALPPPVQGLVLSTPCFIGRGTVQISSEDRERTSGPSLRRRGCPLSSCPLPSNHLRRPQGANLHVAPRASGVRPLAPSRRPPESRSHRPPHVGTFRNALHVSAGTAAVMPTPPCLWVRFLAGSGTVGA